MQKFGLIKSEDERTMRVLFNHPGTFYAAMMDRESLWNPDTIEKILQAMPAGYIEESDLFLILAECVANAVLHGQAQTLGFYARERAGLVLFSFIQFPAMLPRINTILKMAREGRLRECTDDLPGGLGFPILQRLVHRITTSSDLTRLQLWVRR